MTQTNAPSADIFNIPPWVRCLSCNGHIFIEEKNFEFFFTNIGIQCFHCHQLVDWWQTALREVSENFMLNQAFGLVSAMSTFFSFLMKAGERTSYRLSDYKIPPDAKILFVNYTPNGPLFPTELHGNVPSAKISRQVVWLLPVPSDGAAVTEVKVNTLITWIPHSDLDDSWKNLVNAFESYVEADYMSSLIPANVAVESSLAIMLSNYLPQYVGKDRTKTFLKDAATYGHQLNVVLPLIVGLLKLPPLPENIRGQLNSLRGFRNNIAHVGSTERPIERRQCAEMLCAALFGFQYIRFLQNKILRK